MSDERRRLQRSIESIVGSAHVTEEPELKVDGLTPHLLVHPGSADEIAACLRVCSDENAAVVPAGQMSWLESGNQLKRCDVVLSLDRMREVIEYSPPDLTVTVQAGLTLCELNKTATGERQWLSLDPPGFQVASLGAIASCNSSGALRPGFGTPRDYVIGLKLAHVDGKQSKCGGKVVKNVAGYDMNKLYVGSFGTLAVITELTFKLRPLPDRSATVMITSKYRGPLFKLAREVLGSDFQPASVVLTRRLGVSIGAGWPDDALLIRFVDSEPAVFTQLRQIGNIAGDDCEVRELDQAEALTVWKAVADFDSHDVRLRLSVLLSAMPVEFEKALLSQFEYVATADIGAGIIRMALDASNRDTVDLIEKLRSTTTGGTVFVEKAPVAVRREVDAWGDVGSTAELMRSIKNSFDPHSILNPGKFICGL